jgi:probable HAF family extracellular repeat protein
MGDMARAQDWLSSPLRMIVALCMLVAFAGVVLALLAANAAWAADGDREGPSIRSPGFLLDKGRYTTIVAPGARTHTYAWGINDRGDIAGGFDEPSFDGPDGRGHGLVRKRSGRFVQFDVPGAISTIASKINDRGHIVGGSNEGNISVGAPGTKGFLLHRGKLTTINVFGSIETQALGINNHGRVVGEYAAAAGTLHGFLWHRGRLATIDGPGSLGGAVTDINDHGQMVGTYIDGAGTTRGFLLSRGVYTTFAVPGAPITLPTDINDRGQIVIPKHRGLFIGR